MAVFVEGRQLYVTGDCHCSECLYVRLLCSHAARGGVKGREALKELRRMKAKLTKPKSGGQVKGTGVAWADRDFDRDYPMLKAFLFDTSWDDGTAREPGSLVLFAQDGGLKACINDKGVGRVAFTTGGSLAGLLAQIEVGLADESLDWRQSRK